MLVAAQTDDKQLTQRVMQDAMDLGATFVAEAEFKSALCSDKHCDVMYHHQGKNQTVSAKLMVNCAGPWVNAVLKKIAPLPTQRDIDLVLGTHIVVPGTLQQGMYYLEAPQDRRAVFVMPWHGNILIGTTESPAIAPDNPLPPNSDIDYLLRVYNHYFNRPLQRSDIIESFAGLRVLPASEGAAFSLPRDTLIHFDTSIQPRVFSLYGGKLTAHRATALQLLRVIKPYL